MGKETSRRTFVAGLGAAAAVTVVPRTAQAAASVSGPRRSAAKVLHHGVIFTGRRNQRPVQALAVGRDGRILAAGTNAELRRYLGRDTEAVDLRGGFVMPGLQDGHQHAIGAGEALDDVTFEDAALTIPQMRAILAAALDASKDKEPDGWLEVSMWNSAGVLPAGTVVTKNDLDSLPTRRPIYIGSSDGHNAWVNSRALALAGITKNTPDPPGGTIVRDASGEPTGLVKDTATGLVARAIPPVTPAEVVAATRRALGMLTAAGVTTIMDASAGEKSARVYAALAAAGQLKIRTHLAYRVDVDRAKDPRAVLADLNAFRAGLRGVDRLGSGIAKVFMDGVIEYPAQTAALLEPYLVNKGTEEHPRWEPGPSRGSLYFDQATISGLALVLHRAGWQLHAHTIGDRAVRTAVTAFEAAVRRYGDRGNRHTLAHVQLIDPRDIRRAARAHVLACMQLQWAQTDFYTVESLLPYVGKARQSRIYPAADMYRAGIRLTGGTDWPVDALGPWRPVEQAITRRGQDGAPAFHPEQRLSRLVSLSMHTLGTAYQLHQDRSTGTLEPGKQADLVHTDRDLLRVGAHEIHATRAEWTMIGGEVVHESAPPKPASLAARGALVATGARRSRHRSHTACCDPH